MIVFQALGASDLRRSDGYRLVSLLSKPKRLAFLAYDRAAAVTAFRELRDRLATDLDLSPAPETHALIQAVRARGKISTATALASNATHDGTSNSGRSDTITREATSWRSRRMLRARSPRR